MEAEENEIVGIAASEEISEWILDKAGRLKDYDVWEYSDPIRIQPTRWSVPSDSSLWSEFRCRSDIIYPLLGSEREESLPDERFRILILTHSCTTVSTLLGFRPEYCAPTLHCAIPCRPIKE